MASLTIAHADLEVWHVGHKPQPWAWPGWEWATDGRFHGRWDDRQGDFRTVYASSTLQACLLEVLADFRPDPAVMLDLDDIAESRDDAVMHPTAIAGELDHSWLESRAAASGFLTGRFCVVTTAESVATLRPRFIAQALSLGLSDFDAAALKDGRLRTLTQSVATHLYASTDVDGVNFVSRHGDDLELWAVFERADDPAITLRLAAPATHALWPEHPDLVAAFELLGLRWREP